MPSICVCGFIFKPYARPRGSVNFFQRTGLVTNSPPDDGPHPPPENPAMAHRRFARLTGGAVAAGGRCHHPVLREARTKRPQPSRRRPSPMSSSLGHSPNASSSGTNTPGRLEPIEFVEVRSEWAATWKEIHFVEGQIVRANPDLFGGHRSPTPTQSAVRRARMPPWDSPHCPTC